MLYPMSPMLLLLFLCHQCSSLLYVTTLLYLMLLQLGTVVITYPADVMHDMGMIHSLLPHDMYTSLLFKLQSTLTQNHFRVQLTICRVQLANHYYKRTKAFSLTLSVQQKTIHCLVYVYKKSYGISMDIQLVLLVSLCLMFSLSSLCYDFLILFSPIYFLTVLLSSGTNKTGQHQKSVKTLTKHSQKMTKMF